MSQKAFTYRLTFLLAFALIFVFGFNAYIDSRWVFGTVNDYNTKRPIIDERSQKTNYLISQKPSFNNLILGSSRASYFPTQRLKGKWFNYAVSGMYPKEYLGYAQIAEQFAQYKKLDTIIIGLDFWATCKCAIVEYEDPKEVYAKSKSWLKQATNLLSVDAIYESLRTIRVNNTKTENQPFFTLQNLQKNRTSNDDEFRKINSKEQLWYYRNNVYGNAYQYDSSYIEPIKTLIESFPAAHFILYTSPVSPELNALQKELGREKEYTKWKAELMALDAELLNVNQHDFKSVMFFDSHHLKPEYFSIIIQQIN